MMSQAEVSIAIRITHYINPFYFWYKPETAYMQDHAKMQFAAALDEHCERLYGNPHEFFRKAQGSDLPQVGELVALRSNQLGRWIRCTLEEVVVDLTNDTWYQLWAIDEGFPIKSSDKYVRPLPEAYRHEPAHVKRGAIINILPADTCYNYLKDKQEVERRSSWCTGIVSTLETLFDDAPGIMVVEKAKLSLPMSETVYCGELSITTHQNQTFNVVDLLRTACMNQLMVVPEEEYFRELLKMQENTDRKRYLDNNGIDKMSKGVNNFIPFETRKTMPATARHTPVDNDGSNIEEVHLKIFDWLKRNKEACDAVFEHEKAEGERTNQIMNIVPESTKKDASSVVDAPRIASKANTDQVTNNTNEDQSAVELPKTATATKTTYMSSKLKRLRAASLRSTCSIPPESCSIDVLLANMKLLKNNDSFPDESD